MTNTINMDAMATPLTPLKTPQAALIWFAQAHEEHTHRNI